MLEMYYIRGSFVSSDFSIIMTRTYGGFGNTEQWKAHFSFKCIHLADAFIQSD